METMTETPTSGSPSSEAPTATLASDRLLVTDLALEAYLQQKFSAGLRIDASDRTEKKGAFTYLSWVFGLLELKKLFPLAVYGWVDFIDPGGQSRNYLDTPAGPFVRARLQVHPQAAEVCFDHPVLDGKNKPITSPTSFDINTSRMRALSKLISMETGIGLHLYAGEDLPDDFAGGIEAAETDVAEVKTLLEGPLGARTLPDGKSLREVYTKRLEAAGWSRKDVSVLLKTLRSLS